MANLRTWNIILKSFLSDSKIHHVPRATCQHSWGDLVPVASCPWDRRTDYELIQQKWSHHHRRLDRFQSHPIRFDKQSQRFRVVPKWDTAGQINAQGKTTQYGLLSSSCFLFYESLSFNEVKKSLELDGPQIRKWIKWPVQLQWTVHFKERSLWASGVRTVHFWLACSRAYIRPWFIFIFDLSLFVFLFILFLTGEN